MSLRLQLLALGILTLFLPWAGLQMVYQMEASLRQALESSLLDNAGWVARDLAGSGSLVQRSTLAAGLAEPIYVHPLSLPPRLDGLQTDWRFTRNATQDAVGYAARNFADGSRLWLGINSLFLYVFVDVVDDEVVNQAGPGVAPHGDRIVLLFGGDAGQPETLLLANSTPGAGPVVIRAQPVLAGGGYIPAGGFDSNVAGAWVRTNTGFAVEARLPLRLIGERLGVGIIDSDAGGGSAVFSATTWGDAAQPNALIREQPGLDRLLRPYEGGERRVRVLDRDGWVVADSGPLEPSAETEAELRPALIDRFFRYVLRRDDPGYATITYATERGRIADPALLAALDGPVATAWYREGAEFSAIVAAAVPVVPDDPRRGAVLLEQASDSILTLTNKAMLRLVVTMVLLSLLTTAGLLAYASLLSFRVGRLARAAESALGPRGEINVVLPGARANDEIGDLSRSFQDLLGRLREYTQYLESLKSKLSHELRTPLAIVQTSLDNLEQETGPGTGQAYLARLRQGAGRLESILQAMTAATRVEQAISETTIERFDIGALVRGCVAAYDDVYPGQAFAARVPEEPVYIDGSAELIAQLLDKLIDNAVGFAADASVIEVSLAAERREARLTVSNHGPLLPDAMRHQLFDSLVSVRESRGAKPHLGLGLYIVMLIAEFHRGQVSAENLPDGSGVRFVCVLPRSDAGAA